MKMERTVTQGTFVKLFVSSIGILDVGQLYAVMCAPNIAVFHVWDADTYMENAYVHKGNSIPYPYLEVIGLKPGDKVRVMKDESCVFLFRSDFDGDLSVLNSHMIYRASIPHPPVTPTTMSDIPVKASCIELPCSDKTITTCRVDGERYWMELRNADSESCDLIPEECVSNLKMVDGFSYRAKLHGRTFCIPDGFMQFAKAPSVQIGMAGDVLVIEGPKRTCDVCGQTARTSSSTRKGWACPNCAKTLGKGGVMDALVQTAKIIK